MGFSIFTSEKPKREEKTVIQATLLFIDAEEYDTTIYDVRTVRRTKKLILNLGLSRIIFCGPKKTQLIMDFMTGPRKRRN